MLLLAAGLQVGRVVVVLVLQLQRLEIYLPARSRHLLAQATICAWRARNRHTGCRPPIGHEGDGNYGCYTSAIENMGTSEVVVCDGARYKIQTSENNLLSQSGEAVATFAQHRLT